MNIAERDLELTALTNMYEACLQGEGLLVMISGAVGTGKTTIMHAFANRAVENGAVFLGAVASRSEHALPLGVIRQLFREMHLCDASSECLAQQFLDHALLGAAPKPAVGFRSATVPIMVELCELVLVLARKRPLILCVDDLQYADEASLQCLFYIARRIGSSRILMILGKSTIKSDRDSLIHAELLPQPHFRHIRLRPLSEQGVLAILTEKIGEPAGGQLARACHLASGGNPLLVRALVEEYSSRVAGSPSQLVFGDAFAQAVRTAMHRCGPMVTSVALGIAVLGIASSTLLAELLDMTEDSVAQAKKVLNSVGLLNTNDFREAAVRAAVLDGISSDECTAMHRRAARILRDHGMTAAAVAPHLAAGGFEVPWAAGTLREAAEQALNNSDLDTAIRYFRQALRARPSERERAVILASITRAEWGADPAGAARHLSVLSAAMSDGHLTGWDAAALVKHYLWYGRTREAADILDQLDAACPHSDLGAELDSVRLIASLTYPELLGRPAHRQILLGDHVDQPSALPPRQAAPYVLAAAMRHGPNAQTAARAEQILRDLRLDDSTMPAISSALAALLLAGEPDMAAYWGHRLVAEAAARRLLAWQAFLTAIQAAIDIRQGNLTAAWDRAHAALALISIESWGVTMGLPLSSILIASTGTERCVEAARYLEIRIPEGMFKTTFGLYYLYARGKYYLAAGRPHAALVDFQQCGQSMMAWRFDLPVFLPWRTGAAEACLALGKAAEARELMEEQLARLPAAHSHLREISMRLLDEIGVAADGTQAPELISGLSEAERRVALLATRGYTNRQIAGKLYVTVSTVEQHLTRVYRKLGVKRRSDLSPALPPGLAP